MKNRPLCTICLVIFFMIYSLVNVGGAKFVKDLRPSVLEYRLREADSIELTGQIYKKEQKENYQILYLKNNSIYYQNKSLKESKIIIYDQSKESLAIGNIIHVKGRIHFFDEARNPGNFDQKKYYQLQGIQVSAWADEISNIDEKVFLLGEKIYVFRQKWKMLLQENCDEESGTLLMAMLIGDKSEMNEETRELYQANGIGHIFAISGLHLSVIGVGFYKLVRRASGSYLIGGIAGILFLSLYILMIGLSVSAVRAFVMFLFRVGADMTGRHYDNITALSAAAVAVLIWRPLYIRDGGFWLSFGAVLAIIIVVPAFEELSFQSFWGSVAINLTLLPILLYYFYEFPIYSVFLNQLVVPLMSVVLILGLFGSIVAIWFAGSGGIVLRLCGVIFTVYEKSCDFVSNLPMYRFVGGQPEMWRIILYYVFFIGFVVWMRNSERKRIGTAFVVTGMMVLLVPLPSPEKLEVTVIDVGQGDSIFVEGPEGMTYLIDGGSSDVNKVGRYRIEPYLKSRGVGSLDYVFVTHGDGDHTSGIIEMIERQRYGVKIKRLVLPPKEVWDEELLTIAKLAMNCEIPVSVIKEGQCLKEGEMDMRCLAPGKNVYGESGNAASLVMALKYREFDMLFTGDVEGKGEEALIRSFGGLQKKWECVKISHHGSKNSTTEEFLDVAKPAYALISAGRNNSYGHPHEETLQRLKVVGSEVLVTKESGAVSVVTDGRKLYVGKQLNSL